jgi:hypothetical protein
METNNNTNNNYDKLKEIKLLSFIYTEIFIVNVSLKDFFNSDIEILQFYEDIVTKATNSSEQGSYIKIIFTESKDDLLKMSFKHYEKIILLFNMVAVRTKFIEHKDFVVTFPQLFHNIFDLEGEISDSLSKKENVIYVDLSDNSSQLTIKDEKLLIINKDDYQSYIKENTDYSVIKEDLNKVDELTKDRDENLVPFCFNKVALGGSFDHFHLGHKVYYSLFI